VAHQLLPSSAGQLTARARAALVSAKAAINWWVA
jgi:hypothetical protein